MSKPKFTVLEVTAPKDADLELFDAVLSNLGAGEVSRNFRPLNIKAWETVQFTYNGKVYQPFRADYKRNERGNYTVTCHGNSSVAVATQVCNQMGYAIVATEKGEFPDYPLKGDFEATETANINGRSVTVVIKGEA